MAASSPFSFGVHILGPIHIKSYKNGSVVDECFDHPDDMANPWVAIVGLDTVGFRVGRFEARTAPGGTILAAEDFNGAAGTLPAGWASFNGAAPSCLQDGAGRLYITGGGFSEGVYTAVPVGAMYFELQDCIFDDESHGPNWGMIAPYWPGGFGGWYGAGAYRVLARENTGQLVQIPDCTAHPSVAGGWSVGSVRIA